MINFNHSFYILFLCLVMSLAACNNDSKTAEESESEVSAEMDTPAGQFGGLALYTLRDTMAGDPKAVLKEVADIGYQYLEAAGYSDGKFYGMTPAEFKSYLAEIGLIPVSSHHGDVTLDNADAMIAAVKAAGFKYFVIPIPPMGHFKFDQATQKLSMSEDLEEVMSIINTIAEKCSAAGLSCLYHNHNFEFSDIFRIGDRLA